MKVWAYYLDYTARRQTNKNNMIWHFKFVWDKKGMKDKNNFLLNLKQVIKHQAKPKNGLCRCAD